MYRKKSILALVPARAGSRGLPGKNLLPLLGRPLIAWTIAQARASRYLDAVVVSTDGGRIASAARRCGAEVPFRRPSRLATSKARMSDVVRHALESLRRQGRSFDLVMLLQPTSPLRRARDIDEAVELLARKRAGAAVSVCPCEHHPFLSAPLSPGGWMGGFLRARGRNRQELPACFRLNGAVYLAETGYFLKHRGFLGPRTCALVMPAERSVDIDTRFDFDLAAGLMRRGRKGAMV
jgi:N-acylneuraminate cytidylyltransferase/CMP-N,N'-diacetyllegionaminic acid synthase